MRPEILFKLFAEVSTLPKVGPRTYALLEKLTGPSVVDLLWHLPAGMIDRSYSPKIADAQAGQIATITAMVDRHIKAPSKKAPYRIWVHDDTAAMCLTFFHAHSDYLSKILPVGEQRVISGKVEVYGNDIQMTHPDHIVPLAESETIQGIEPVYPLTQGISLKMIRPWIDAALSLAPDQMPEWLDPSLISREGWMPWHESLIAAHHPDAAQDLEPTSKPRMRLAYDELLANQLALGLMRHAAKKSRGRAMKISGALAAQVQSALPFDLTTCQKQALSEIKADLESPNRMLRLLQGDVGSGKTVVALMAALWAVEAGHQAAIMAPTEILARQHLSSLLPLCEKAGVSIELLTGRNKGKGRTAMLERLKSGETKIIVGTHALFQSDVHFADLGLAVIDEQHRFGVHQRLDLAAKGASVDVLVMTATPIPRTLMLTAYGDMDVSKLPEKPPGRQPIDTRVLPNDRLSDVVEGVARALKDGRQIYWVCPLVAESEALDLAAAEERFDVLAHTFPGKVGLVHGQMKATDKDKVMAAFAAGDILVLVATTVIEVGVDVPKATIMVIEHAERFGLSQLHQLRGRIGRGAEKSTCILVYAQPLGQMAKARLKIIRETDDGFVIAEEDLKLRGAGELLGTRQSGFPEFRLAEAEAHSDLLAIARKDAELIIETDPALTGKRGPALRTLLYLFRRDEAVKLLRSG